MIDSFKKGYSIDVVTRVSEDGLIEINTDFMGRITRETMDTKLQHVRESLIKLGWTPPPEKKPDCRECKHFRPDLEFEWCEKINCPFPDHPKFEKRD